VVGGGNAPLLKLSIPRNNYYTD